MFCDEDCVYCEADLMYWDDEDWGSEPLEWYDY